MSVEVKVPRLAESISEATLVEWLKAETNRLSAGAPPDKRGRMLDLFVLSSRYEWQFWTLRLRAVAARDC